MPQKVLHPVPAVRVAVDISHAAAQAGLELGGVPAEQVHDGGPRETSEDGPGMVADDSAAGGFRDEGKGQAAARLHGQARQRQRHTRKHVDDDLLVHARNATRPRPLPEDDIPA